MDRKPYKLYITGTDLNIPSIQKYNWGPGSESSYSKECTEHIENIIKTSIDGDVYTVYDISKLRDFLSVDGMSTNLALSDCI